MYGVDSVSGKHVDVVMWLPLLERGDDLLFTQTMNSSRDEQIALPVQLNEFLNP